MAASFVNISVSEKISINLLSNLKLLKTTTKVFIKERTLEPALIDHIS